MAKKAEPEKRKYYAISLFSGAGGFDIGIEAAGFTTKLCTDLDLHSCQTLENNKEKLILRNYQSNQIRAFAPSGKNTDPFETIIRYEKANRDHGRILGRIASIIRVNDNKVFENIFIDLLAVIGAQDFIFEVKSNNTKNVLSQIRKAVAQLYKYRYRSNRTGAILCIVLQMKPLQDWVIDYLVKDRDIMICWMVDDFRFECPPECFSRLSPAGIVQ